MVPFHDCVLSLTYPSYDVMNLSNVSIFCISSASIDLYRPSSGALCLLIVQSSSCSDTHIILILESFNLTYRIPQSLSGSDWVHDQPSWQYEDVISIIITWLVLCSLCAQLVLNFDRTSQTLGGSYLVREVCNQQSWIWRCHFHDCSPILLAGLVLNSFRVWPNLNLLEA